VSVLINRESEERLLAEVAASSGVDVTDTLSDLDKLSITGDVFAHEDTRDAHSLMREFLVRGDPCGVLQLEHEGKRRGLALGWLIIRQAEAQGSLMFGRHYADELRELAGRRRLHALALDIKHRAESMTNPVDETVVHLSSQMNALVSGASARIETLDTKMGLVARQLEQVAQGQAGGVLKTGMEVWDRNVGGWWPTLNVIGGHPSRGKSGLVAAQILEVAKQGIPGIIFTLEDPAEWLVYRYLAHLSRVPGFLLRTRELTADQHEAVGQAWPEVERLGRYIMFDERSRLKPSQLVAAARDAILTRGAKWVVADHAGEFSYDQRRGGDRHDLDVAEGLSEMRSVAKSYGVPFVLLSQLTRSSKPPHTMQDFKNASSVEECARMAAIVWTQDGNPLEPTVSIVKNTNGKRDFDMRFKLDAVSGLLVEPPPPTSIPGQKALL
jgi:replicative DNA helicase